MKRLLIILLLSSFLVMPVFGEDEELFVASDAQLEIGLVSPSSIFRICNPENKCANIDFEGNKVIYSGDLEVAESAKIFFEHIFGICQAEMKPKANTGGIKAKRTGTEHLLGTE